MASTSNKNHQGNYKLEQLQNNKISNFVTYTNYAKPEQDYLAGDGLLVARMAGETLSNNSCDIESFLFGIGSTNLVNPQPEITPSFKSLQSLSIMDKTPLIMPKDLIIQQNQRPELS